MNMKSLNKKTFFIGMSVFAALGSVAFIQPEYQANSDFKYRNQNNLAFKEGEKLTFRAHYGIINAAKITMELDASKSKVNNRSVYKSTVEGATYKSFDWAFKVRDKFESWVDADAIATLRYAKSVREDNYTDKDYALYMHDSKKLKNTDGTLTMPEYTQDIASALYYARSLDLQNAAVGSSFPINVYLDNTIHNLSFKVIGRETLKTDIGKIKCIILRPKLVVDRVFKGDDDMTVLVSDDANKIPIRIKSAIKVGSIKVDITGYSGLRNYFSAKI